MEEMKIRFSLILPLLIILMLCSCSSTPAAESRADSGSQDVHKEKKQNQKKLLFEDWKYKGFGQELPAWFEPAYKADEAKLKSLVPELKDKEFVIIRGEGVNSDQAERNLDINKKDIPDGYELYDSFWAMTAEGAYVSLALYKEI